MLSRNSRWVLSLLGAAVTAAGSVEAAQDADWTCWYAGGHQLQCILVQAASGVGVVAEAPATPPAKPPAKPGVRAIPDTVREIQAGGAQLYGRVVRIPLMNEPDDFVLAQQLARYTVCGPSAACRMTFTRNPQDIAMLQEQRAGRR